MADALVQEPLSTDQARPLDEFDPAWIVRMNPGAYGDEPTEYFVRAQRFQQNGARIEFVTRGDIKATFPTAGFAGAYRMDVAFRMLPQVQPEQALETVPPPVEDIALD